MVAPVNNPSAAPRPTPGDPVRSNLADGPRPVSMDALGTRSLAPSARSGSTHGPTPAAGIAAQPRPAGAPTPGGRPPPIQHSDSLAMRRDNVASVAGSAGASLVVHLIVLALFAAVTWAVGGGANEIITAFKATVVESPKRVGPPGGFRFPGRANIDRPDEPGGRLEPESIRDLAALVDTPDVMPVETEGGGAGAELKNDAAGMGRSDIIGIGPGGGLGAGSGTGGGPGRRSLAGGGPVGSLWGVGEGQRAESIVYVLDRSGSMSDTFDLLRKELMRALGTLEPDQMFNVIWFSEGKATELAPRLLKATTENKRDAFEAIKRIVPSGQTEPMDAIRKGFGYRPDVMFLLSDGDFGEDNDKVIKLIKEKNPRRSTTVNTILFVYDTSGGGDKVLRAIAQANNGTFKHVTEQDAKQ